MERAYAPYSRFRVGAALRAEDGSIHVGANVENAAYPQGQCAEASAIGALIAAGRKRITEVAVISDGEDYCVPCGGCRQRLREFIVARRGDPPLREHAARARRRRSRRCCRAPSARSSCRGEARCRRGFAPRLGIVLGSGLGGLADALDRPDAVPVRASSTGFPQPSVAGHGGHARASASSTACRSRSSRAASTSTRAAIPARCAVPVRTLQALGAEALLLTNAAGSLRAEVGPGPPDGDHRPHQPARRQPAHRAQRRRGRPALPEPARRLRPGAARSGCAPPRARSTSTCAEGVYLATAGPSFETPAEIRAFRTLGADAVGMSTVPEVILARHCGLRVAAVSAITNLAEGMGGEELSHEQTLRNAEVAARDLVRLVQTFAEDYAT